MIDEEDANAGSITGVGAHARTAVQFTACALPNSAIPRNMSTARAS
jgi:hypothetical protein